MLSKSEEGEAKTTITREYLKDIRITTDRISSAYPLEYLAKFFASIRRSDEVKISFKDGNCSVWCAHCFLWNRSDIPKDPHIMMTLY